MTPQKTYSSASLSTEEEKVVMLDILSAVDKFCSENHIVYSMACGTMLGAVRHKGFIPWDDDIDIYIPREDFDRMEQLFPDLLDGKYRFASLSRTAEWYNAYGKVYDDRTLMITNGSKTMQIGINIDVYPIDDVPDDDSKWRMFRKEQVRAVLNVRYKNLRFSSKKSIGGNVSLLWKKVPLLFYSKGQLLLRLNQLVQSNNGKGFHRSFECVQGLMQNVPFPKALFDDIVYWPFEDRQFKGFRDADCYLKNAYGDYMTLPPEEKRVAHHGYPTFWK